MKEKYTKVMNKTSLKGTLLLFIADIVWGFAFVAQSVGMEHLNAFAFNSIRNFIGVLALLPIFFWNIHKQQQKLHISIRKIFTKDLLLGGLICGTALCLASNFQQLGIEISTVGKSAFITTLYIVLVPIFGIFFKKKVSLQVWFAVGAAIVGLYLLCMKDEVFVLSIGDIYLLLCAFFFTLQIMAVDYFITKTDGIALSMMQFFVTGVFSGIGMIVTEVPTWTEVTACAIPLLYAGAISSGVGYTLQIIGQKYLQASVASLVMSLESVIATLAGWLLLKEILSTKELIGCGLVFTAVIVTQLPSKTKEGESL